MNILITGGTGSLGQALVRKLVLDDSVSRVVVFSRDEWKQAEMARLYTSPKLRFFLGDVRDSQRLSQALVGIDTVIHAAALKRVDAVAYNPSEVIKTNIWGTANVIDASVEAGVKKVMVVSSDKAVEPTNIYGVTKAAAEHYAVQANSFSYPQGTRVSCVRYGNVLGSRGSVLEIWRRQVEREEVISVHPTATRFWITMNVAVGFVLDSLKVMEGGEIFVPKLKGATVTTLAQAAGLPAFTHAEFRPGGEKLHESLLTAGEIERTRDVGFGWEIRPAMHSWRGDWPRGPRGEQYPFKEYTSWAVEKFTVQELREMLQSEGL